MKMQTAGLFKTWSRFFFIVERGILAQYTSEHQLEQQHLVPLRDAMVVEESSNNCALSIITVELGTLHLLCDSVAERAAWTEAIEANVGALEEAVEAAALKHHVPSDSVLDEQERMFMEQEALSDRMAAAQGVANDSRHAPLFNPVDYDFKAIIAAARDAQATGKKGSYVQGKVQSVFTWGKKK
jgi:hypothetical protein